MSIASEISRLQSAKADIKTSIEAKGVTVPSATKLDGYSTLIDQISTGSSGLPEWMKDGDTHIWIDLQYQDQLEQQLRVILTGTVDWGDGTTESVNASSATTLNHTYASIGRYRIDIKPSSGTFSVGSGSSYNIMGGNSSARYRKTEAAYQVEIGSKRITSLPNYALGYIKGVIRIYIPKTITTLGGQMFRNNSSLRTIEFEDYTTITSFNSDNAYYYCYSMMSDPPNIPTTKTSLTGTFVYCQCITEVTIPSNITALPASALAYLNSLKYLHCLPTTPPTAANANCFSSLPATCVIEVPTGSLSAYQTAQYWDAYASQMVEV